MSVQTRRPLRMLGGAQRSGNPYTGEVPHTRGGQLTGVVFSGSLVAGTELGSLGAVASGGHILFASGAGRLNTVQPHQGGSGVAIYFYDAGTIQGSGVLVASGTRVIGIVPANLHVGALNLVPAAPTLYEVPFTSGLCAAIPSGTPGFSISYTLEVDPVLPSD